MWEGVSLYVYRLQSAWLCDCTLCHLQNCTLLHPVRSQLWNLFLMHLTACLRLQSRTGFMVHKAHAIITLLYAANCYSGWSKGIRKVWPAIWSSFEISAFGWAQFCVRHPTCTGKMSFSVHGAVGFSLSSTSSCKEFKLVPVASLDLICLSSLEQMS